MNFIDIVAGVDKVFAAINIIAATYFHYRYVVGPSSSKNFRSAQLHWSLSGFFVILAVLADNTLSTATTRRPRHRSTHRSRRADRLPPQAPAKQRTPTFLDQIATDDINDRTRAHQTTGEFIHNHDFAVLNHIVLVFVKQLFSTRSSTLLRFMLTVVSEEAG